MTLQLAEPERAGFVDLAGTRLRVWEWGSIDAPPMLCLHGAYDHGRMWDELGPQLAELGFRVLAPDLRGHGDSERLRSGSIWAASAVDIIRLARWAGVPAGIVGHSFGGGQALAVAAAVPGEITWVVNIDGLGPPPAAFEEEHDLAAVAAAGVASAERVLTQPPRTYGSRDEMARRRGSVNVRLPEGWLAHLVLHGSTETASGFVWKSDPMFSVGFPGDFDIDYLHAEHADVPCPVLVITGAENDTWSEMSDDELADRLRHIRDHRHVAVAGAGHYVHIEQPAMVLAHIRGFLQELGVV